MSLNLPVRSSPGTALSSSLKLDVTNQTLFEKQELLTSSSCKTSPERTVIGSNSLASPTLACVETSLISERQLQWDRQAQNADQKQAELFHMQWNLIREQMNTFSRELVAIRAELKAVKDLQVRVPELELKLSHTLELASGIDNEARRRKEADDALASELRTLSDALASEVRARAAELEEVSRQLGILRQAGDRETKERRALGDELAQKLQDLSEREHADAGLRAQLLSWRQDLEGERAERAGEMAASKRTIQALEGQLTPAVRELRGALDQERADRENSDAGLRGQLATCRQEIASSKSAQADDAAALQRALAGLEGRVGPDLTKNVNELQSLLADEAQKRADADASGQIALSRLQAQVDADSRERARGLAEALDRLKALSDALGQEGHDRSLAVSDVEGQLRSLRLMVEQEAKQRAADRALIEENSRIPPVLRAELEAEVRSRKEGDAHLGSEIRDGLKALSDSLGKEMQERIAGDKDAMRLAQQAIHTCENEVRDRQSSTAECMDHLKELSMALEQERLEREKGDAGLRSVVGDCREELRAERNDRIKESADLGRSLQSLESTVVHATKELRSNLEAETSELARAGREVRAKLESEVGRLDKMAQDMNGSLQDVRRALEAEVQVRTEENSRFTMNVSRLQNNLESECQERGRVAEDLSVRLRALSDALGMEASDRRDAVAELDSGQRSLSARLEHEARLRAQAISAAQEATTAEALERAAGDEALLANLRSTIQRLEAMIEGLRDALWNKMVALMDRLLVCGREWRDTPPTLDFSQRPTLESPTVVGSTLVASARIEPLTVLSPRLSPRASSLSPRASGVLASLALRDGYHPA